EVVILLEELARVEVGVAADERPGLAVAARPDQEMAGAEVVEERAWRRRALEELDRVVVAQEAREAEPGARLVLRVPVEPAAERGAGEGERRRADERRRRGRARRRERGEAREGAEVLEPARERQREADGREREVADVERSEGGERRAREHGL